LSLLGGGGLGGLLAATGVTGGVEVTLETLMGTDLTPWVAHCGEREPTGDEFNR
jgi:hypothetical protein